MSKTPNFRHVPALDGLRAVAVIAVVLFHGGAPFAGGGYIGVTMFFTLSGFLITTVAVLPVVDGGEFSLGRFWSRRFRRLAPAALTCLAASAVVWSWLGMLDRSTQSDIRAALFNVANWWFIHDGNAYGDTFGNPNPVEHFWSLAIEEQFYLVFPLVIVGVLALSRRRGWQPGRVLGIGAGVIAAISVAITFAPLGTDRIYFGTDTRIVEILLGVVLAVWRGPLHRTEAAGGTGQSADDRVPGDRPLIQWAERILPLVATAGLFVAVGWMRLDGPFGVRGGLPLVAIASAVIIDAAMRPTWLATTLSVRPLVAIGAVSYGAYLYHWPVFAVLSPDRLGFGGIGLFAIRLVVTAVLTVMSYRWIEQPVRRGVWPDRERSYAVLVTGMAGVLVITTALPVTSSVRDAVADAEKQPLVLGLIEPTPSSDAGVAAVESTAAPTTDTTSTTDGAAEPGIASTVVSAPPTTVAPPPDPIVAFSGDSVPWLLGQAIAPIQDEWDVRIMNLAVEACDGARGAPTFRYSSGEEATEPETCTPFDTTWPRVFGEFGSPAAIVIMIGAVALMDRLVNNTWTDVCQPDYATWYSAELAGRIDWIRANTSARIIVPTVPWPDPVSEKFGVPDDRVARTDCVNSILDQVTSSQPDVVRIDLARYVCPSGPNACAPYRTDGLHYIDGDARTVGRWMMPQIVASLSG